MDIIEHIDEVLQEILKKTIEEGIKSKCLGDLNTKFKVEWSKLGCEILGKIYEGFDDRLLVENRENIGYQVIKKDKRTIMTSIGDVTFKKRLYRDNEGKSICLFDEYMCVEKNSRLSIDAKARCLNEVIDSSYRKGGLNATISEEYITKVSMMNVLKDLEIPEIDYKVEKKKKVDYLYIDADEDHIALQREKEYSAINKLIYVYEKVEPEAPLSKRNVLINAHYFGGITTKNKTNSMLWGKVRQYIEANYEVDKIKMIYLNGDGASWIKEGLSMFKNMTFVMDKFHITKYVNDMTNHLEDSKEEAKEELYEAIKENNMDKFESIIGKLYCTSINKASLNNINKGEIYFRNNFESIALRFSNNPKIMPCSAEGHISHRLSTRMSSRPMGWTIEGANKMTALRLYKINGGDIYELCKNNYLKEPKIIFKSNLDNDMVYNASIVSRDLRKVNKQKNKYIAYYNVDLSDYARQVIFSKKIDL